MKLCVFGSRTFNNYDYLKLILDNLPNELGLEIISGCANGADELAIKYAVENNIPLEKCLMLNEDQRETIEYLIDQMICGENIEILKDKIEDENN